MRLALVCPANINYMPYLQNYITILNSKGISYDIINWDRLGIEKESKLTFKDQKVTFSRNIFDYVSYSKFVKSTLNNGNYDKVVIFGLQLMFFLKKYITSNYNQKYIIDIRDYHKIFNYYRFNKEIKSSKMVVISSHGFKKWLPNSDKYILNHNYQNEINYRENITKQKFNTSLKLSYVGAIRDYDLNKQLIKELLNHSNIELVFNGDGVASEKLKNVSAELNAKNVTFTGRYKKEDEDKLYKKSDLINILLPNNDLNSKSLLPNRLYKAVEFSKPIITQQGTFLSEIIEKYNLGFSIPSIVETEKCMEDYLNLFSISKYEKGRKFFLNKVNTEQGHFKKSLLNFLDE